MDFTFQYKYQRILYLQLYGMFCNSPACSNRDRHKGLLIVTFGLYVICNAMTEIILSDSVSGLHTLFTIYLF